MIGGKLHTVLTVRALVCANMNDVLRMLDLARVFKPIHPISRGHYSDRCRVVRLHAV